VNGKERSLAFPNLRVQRYGVFLKRVHKEKKKWGKGNKKG